MPTQEEYYGNEELHGNYQYTSLKDIVDMMLAETKEDDSYLKNTSRTKILIHAKQAIREVNRSAANDVLAFEITVPDSLVFTLPEDFVNYARVSVVVNEDGALRLQPLDINYKINTAIGYLQDDAGEIIFDDLGNIITADSLNAYARPYKTYSFSEGYQPTLDTSKLSKYGEFTIDERRGKILFSSNLMNKEIVMEYVSDGLQAGLSEDEITIHKDLRLTVENWTYFACIERKRFVPQSEKDRALQRYKTTLHQAKVSRANFDLLRIARALRVNTSII